MSLRAPETLVALLSTDLSVEVQSQWAIQLAQVRKLDLLLLERVESSRSQVVELDLGGPVKGDGAGTAEKLQQLIGETSELRAGTREALETGVEEGASESRSVHIRLGLIYFDSLPSMRRVLLAELAKEGIVLFTVAVRDITDRSDVEWMRERRLVYRYVRCEVVVGHGLERAPSFARVLVATDPSPNCQAALQMGLEYTRATNGTLTAVHVNPDVGEDAERVGARRLTRILEKALGPDAASVERRIVIDDQPVQGVRQAWDEGGHDLLLVGASRVPIEHSFGVRLGKGIPLAFVRAATPVRGRLLEFVEEGVTRFVPQIERDNRIDLVDRLQSNAAWNFDFIILMILATGIAAIGLIQDSVAVVIGAMLVAPLMTPMLGLGLALVQGNPALTRLSLRTIKLGVGVSLLVATVVGFGAVSFVEPTREMLARGGPGLLDLVVAFLAGLAAAYASSRPNLIAALPGVAIAAALVPPIATSGLALSLGHFVLAFDALLLFCINLVTIVLATKVSFWTIGLRDENWGSRKTAQVGNMIAVAVLGLGIYLSLGTRDLELTEELPPDLLAAVTEMLPTEYRLTGVSVGYDELGVRLNLDILGREPAPEELADEIRNLASEHYDQPVRVRLLTRLATDATDPNKAADPDKAADPAE